MSNKASDNLHRLIKSMSKPEKRYFKVFSSRHIIGDENNYQLLFDAIDKQEEYNEEKLLRKFKDRAFSKRFSIAKNRLYAAIIKSLDSFHSNSSIDAQLHRQIHAAEILYNKSLYDQSLKVLESAQKVAKKYEALPILAEIAKWEKRIIEKGQYEEISGINDLKKILDADRDNIQNQELYNELWYVKSVLFQKLYREGKVRSKEDIATFKSIIEQASQHAQGKKLSIENQYLLNHIHSAYHFGLGEYEACLPHLEKNIKLIESKSAQFQDEKNIYISVLTNAIHVNSRLGRVKEAYAAMEKLRKAAFRLREVNNEDLEIRLFALTNSTELTLYAQNGDFEKGLSLVPEIESGLKKYGDHLSSVRKAHLYFNTAIMFFGLERYNESLKWINRLLNDISIDQSKDIHCMAQILNLIIHLELKNEDLLPYTLRSTQRFLETRKKVFRFETVMLDFVNERLKKRQEKTKDTLLNSLVDELKKLRADDFERTVFEYFDFLAWAESKITGKSFKEQLVAA